MIIQKYKNLMQRDPWVVFHDGYYYHCCANNGVELYVGKTKDLFDLQNAEYVKVYTAPETGLTSKELWAPELHIIDGKCYIYVACDDGNNVNHRMYVLENNSNDPQQPYIMHGKITDATDKWAIDGTVFNYKGQMYFAWSGWETGINLMQHIYIAKMSDPYTISSERVSISHPEKRWEKHGGTGEPGEDPLVNEGPAALIHGDDLFMTFSASGCWTKFYCVGYVKLCGEDLLDPNNWVKCKRPMLRKSRTVTGPGHHSFTKVGDDDYIVYHAFDKDAWKLGKNPAEREQMVNIHAQKVEWKNGLPYVGKAK